ncbi:alpha/beta hydrolase [Alteromonas sp. ASW11-19]|uniref:Alpha/beta hydrolase n=1 Tax=Alteromonas salexigens TaxID=2982530 RepID=A0ABT2VLJ9_9ALTE|nr:alpha/beta hydrolase [Alteromonas salexigens]MCU7553929.1 alpha/beta hydrolase [Alteromonas salexigens]
MKRIVGLLLVVVGSQFGCVSSESGQGVSYQQVVELPSRSATSIYRYGESPLQVIHHYAAAQPARTALVFVHGGCWLQAYDISHSKGWMTHLADAGIDVYGIEYRRTGDEGGGWPGTKNDVVAALNWLDSHFKQAGQPDKLVVAGHSAGGHLALLTASKTTLNADKVIGLAAITDITSYAEGTNSCQQAVPAFMGGEPQHRPDAYQQAQPDFNQINTKVTLLQGQADTIVPVGQASVAGVQTELVEGAGHFDWLYPQSPAFSLFYNQVIQ